MVKIIILVLLTNFITCLIARLIQGGRFTYNKNIYPAYNGKMILIAGMLSQPESAYQYINMPYGCSGYLKFSLLGYNPKKSGKQLKELAKSKDYVIGISVGCKSIIYADSPGKKRILVNPCTHSITLKAEYQMLLQYLSPILEVVSYALGWLSILPVIKTKLGDRYSLALLADQLFWIYYGDPEYEKTASQVGTGLILSKSDEFLENDIISEIYRRSSIEKVPARHGFIASQYVAQYFNEAINKLLAN